LQRHRFKNGIPKEEEEKSREPTLPEAFLQCNIIGRLPVEYNRYFICFIDDSHQLNALLRRHNML